ncbi:Lyzozyme M1 (1,4-beta-N-acetylmuramidase), GH25 family [Pseudobutyrivibrio sp. UC1225]|uniref:glycoside hydrolase family 25 protein n=1 Tax=Pseudobutyrivibrio sp. UC1225 TaxID=1798185 RepID=UPI0008E1FF5C|nr:GH25 family lysozyme [Pseudobutyrivibrio sp. UC1225]SFN77152.1 Lyzozyme M1 (1,4-beta-N-acetylmuramidase), GH25 family [Pseudobutyrivibrio sp. UC1225]
MRGILESIRFFFATSKAARIALAVVVGASALGAGGAGIYAIMHDDVEEVVEEVEVEEEAAAEDVYIPAFKSVVLTSESLEKDLTIYFSDTNDNAITGVPFQVKLLKPSAAEGLQTYIDEITKVDSDITEIIGEDGDVNDMLQNRNVDITVTDENGEVVDTQKGHIKDDPLYQLILDKETAIQSYAMAVKEADGQVYTDDDEDGVIAEKDMEPGDYVACLMYDFDNEEIYEPSDFATAVNVKDKVEFKVQKEIKKQIKKDVAAEDNQPKEAAPVEAVLQDTVEYVASSKVENGGSAKGIKGSEIAAPKSTKGTSKATKKSEVRTSVVHKLKQEVKNFNITVIYKADDKELGKETVAVPQNTEKTFDAKTFDGYTLTSEKQLKVKADKDKTIEFKYKKNAPSPSPTTTPSVSPSPTATPSPTASPSPTTTPDPTKEPTKEPTQEPTKEPTATPSPSASPSPTSDPTPTPENQTGAINTRRPVAVSFTTNRFVTLAARVRKIAANTATEEKATLDMSYSNGVFTITATTNVGSVTVNGTAVTMKDGKGTFTVTKDGDYTLAGVPTWSDKVAATDAEKLSVTYTVSGYGTASTERLKDKEGHELFLDEALTKPATVADYAADKTYYFKAANYIYYGWQSIGGASYYFDKNGNKVTGEQVIQGVKYNFGPDGALLVKGTGIDVSKYQGNIDWNQAKSAVSFAIIRCGYRGQTDGQLHEDPYFYKNMKGAKAAGVATGVYIFSRAVNEAEAVQEASMAVAMANSAGGCAYPIFIDMEDTARGGGLSAEQRTAIANAFIATVQSSGYKAGVYCSKNWMNQRMNAGGINGSAYIWIAQYNTSCTYGGKYSIWQYSSKGSVPGIKGNVDMNKSFF